jgi:hypothetical protein
MPFHDKGRLTPLLLFAMALPLAAQIPSFRVSGTDAGPWTKIFSSVNVAASANSDAASIIVIGPKAQIDVLKLAANHIVVVEGDSALARQIGITPTTKTVSVRHLVDTHAPGMQIVWQQQVPLPISTIPENFQVFARERWTNAPVEAGKRTEHGAILWLATSPGQTGIERYPYVLQALADLGLTLPARATGLWAFFDSSYRIRADSDYLARRWRKSGISVLHVAAWHNVKPDAERDEYLKKLITACHRNAILVYAWLELPHVSEQFWTDHPEWREKTATGQDAALDWRKLMNLQNPDCKAAVADKIKNLLQRFDWDGVNMAELYFESLEGPDNPARFTPMNDDVRKEFEQESGFDPKLLFDPVSSHAMGRDPAGLRRFLDFRASLVSHMQAEWLATVERARSGKPWLDVVLTQIDDRLEPGIRDALGADIAASLPMIESKKLTLLVEDPAPLWNLGAARYAKLAEEYRNLVPDRQRLAVDINVVERYQDVYPTKKQTGVELFELVHEAAESFPRVALYFENSLERQDLSLLPAAASAAKLSSPVPDELIVDSPQPVRIQWRGPAQIDGVPWPIHTDTEMLIPTGHHTVSTGFAETPVNLIDFNADIQQVVSEKDAIDVSYTSRSRAIAVLGCAASAIEVDGAPFEKPNDGVLLLPAGEHILTLHKQVPPGH